MSEELEKQEVQETAAEEAAVPVTDSTAVETAPQTQKGKFKLTKKKIIILSAAAAVILIAVIAFALLHKSHFEKVKDECVQIAGMISGGDDYFTIDTKPDAYDNLDSSVAAILLPRAQANALKAIRYANEALGFNGSLYSQMTRTTALMGRQKAENDKYIVTWTYHPDDGLEVTYEKK